MAGNVFAIPKKKKPAIRNRQRDSLTHKEPWVQLACRVRKRIHKAMKEHCIVTDQSMQDYVEKLVCKDLKIPREVK